MAKLTTDQILKALQAVQLPNGQDIVTSGCVTGLACNDGHVTFAIEVAANQGDQLEPLRQFSEKLVSKIPGVQSVAAVLTAHRSPESSGRTPQPLAREKLRLPNIKKIIAVASGKGGVGKSTTAANLALALSQKKIKVGLLDADIYGPSVPRLFGLRGKPAVDSDKKMIPMEKFGLKIMSMGFLVDEDAPMIWRGPMVHGAITQLFRDVAWGDLDCLVVDLPPGTGDAQLTMAQFVPLSGAIIVSTPQDLALIDARKGLAMFQKVDVPVLGIVENMSYFLCPHCGTRSDIFHHGGARHEADRLKLPFLGEVPLRIEIRETSDQGEPIVHRAVSEELTKPYHDIASKIMISLAFGA